MTASLEQFVAKINKQFDNFAEFEAVTDMSDAVDMSELCKDLTGMEPQKAAEIIDGLSKIEKFSELATDLVWDLTDDSEWSDKFFQFCGTAKEAFR